MRLPTLLLFFLASGSLASDPFSLMRARAQEIMCWPPQSEVASTATAALSLAASLNGSCCWSDINYNDPTDRADWSTQSHLDRTLTMLEALTVPGSPVFEDKALTASAHCALAVWLDHGFTNTNCA